MYSSFSIFVLFIAKSFICFIIYRNILYNNQEDQSSRWSSMSNSPPQV